MNTSIVISAKKPEANYVPTITGWSLIDRDEKRSGGRLYWGQRINGISKIDTILNAIFQVEKNLKELDDVYIDIGLFVSIDAVMFSLVLDPSALSQLSELKCKLAFSLYFADNSEGKESDDK